MEQYYHTSPFRLTLRPSLIPNSGMGVFTEDAIPAHTCIDEYQGTLCSAAIRGAYVLEIDEDCHIDAWEFPRCYMGMLNDCSFVAKQTIRKKKRKLDITPNAYYVNNVPLQTNCEFSTDPAKKKAYVYAIVDIPAGSELFVSYGDEYWKNVS
jgi:hypothetical protein